MARRKKPQRRGRGKATSRPAQGGAGKRSWKPPDPTLLGLWLIVFLPPLIFLPGLTDNFRLPKLLLTELLALFSLLLLALRLWNRPAIDWRQLLRIPAVAIVMPVLFVASLGFFFGEHGEVTRRALPSLWIGGLALVGWSLALRRQERDVLLRALMWPAFFLAFFALLQFHDIFDPFSFQDRVTDRTGLTSLAGGAFDLSGYLVLPLLLGQACWPGASKKQRWLLAAFLLVGAWATVASRTLTALIALALGSFMLWRRAVPARRLIAAGAVAAAVLAVLVFVGPLQERASKITRSLQKGEINRLLTGRLDAWRGAMWMLEEHPVLGVGHGAFRAEFGPARLELSERGVKFFRGQKRVFFTNAHSDVLNAAAEWGLLGAVAMLASSVLFVLTLRRRWSKGPERAPPDDDREVGGEGAEAGEAGEVDPGPSHGIRRRDLELAALAALLVLCSTYFPLHLALLAYPWMLFLSGLLSQDEAEELTDKRIGGDLTNRLLMAALIVAIAFAGWMRFHQARDLLGASRLVAVAEGSILQMAQGGTVPPPLLRRNLELLRRAGEMDPAEVGVPIAEGGHFFLLKSHDAALRAYERAAKLEMRAEIFANIARVHLAAGRRQEALAAIDTAVTLDLTQRSVFDEIIREEKRRERAAREKKRR